MSEYARCDNCGGRWDRPGLFGCDQEGHPVATRAQRVVEGIEYELNRRRNVGWGGVDPDIRDEIRDRLAQIIETYV